MLRVIYNIETLIVYNTWKYIKGNVKKWGEIVTLQKMLNICQDSSYNFCCNFKQNSFGTTGLDLDRYDHLLKSIQMKFFFCLWECTRTYGAYFFPDFELCVGTDNKDSCQVNQSYLIIH